MPRRKFNIFHTTNRTTSDRNIYFECNNLDKSVNELIGKGIEFDEMPNDKNWLWCEAHLKYIDKNHLILYYAGENRLNPPLELT